MMLSDLLVHGDDCDVYDDVYDIGVTVCLPDQEDCDYDRFCNEICRHVEADSVMGDGKIVARWSSLIENNIDAFRDFSEKYWHDYNFADYDDDEFVYAWIRELHYYIAGYVSDSFYEFLYDFVKRLQ